MNCMLEMKFPCTGVILSGGNNSRFSGKNKAFARMGGLSILDRIYSALDGLFEEIILVSNDSVAYIDWNLTVVPDLYPFRSSLTGLHAGLFFAATPYVFVTASDTPFVKKELIQTILDSIEFGFDAFVPETDMGIEPLFAVYSKKSIVAVNMQIARQKFKIRSLFKYLRTKYIPEDILREKDPDLLSFININTPAEFDAATILEKSSGIF